MFENISVSEALMHILERVRFLGLEDLNFRESLHRICAKDVRAPLPHPSTDNSAMDGYGVMAEDCSNVPIKLPITGTILAGDNRAQAVRRGEAVRIMTGAGIPEGVDTVIPFEDAGELNGKLLIESPPVCGQHIRRSGEDYHAGDILVSAGKRISPADIALMASIGAVEVPVSVRPRVSILSTGNELVDPSESPGKGNIRDSNTGALEAIVKYGGGIARPLGIGRDTPERIGEMISNGLDDHMILVTGGVSMGQADYVRDTLRALGAEMIFFRIRQRPGHPMAFALLNDVPVFLLPGNPVSAMICCTIYVCPALRKMMGVEGDGSFKIPVTLSESIRVKAGRTYFLRMIVEEKEGALFARRTGPQGSGIMTSMSRASGLLEVPEEVEVMEAGETWPVMLFDW